VRRRVGPAVRSHLKERDLFHRVFADVPAIVVACARAGNDPFEDNGRVASLTACSALEQVRASRG